MVASYQTLSDLQCDANVRGNAGSGIANNPNHLVMTPVIAVGTATGSIYIISVSSGQV